MPVFYFVESSLFCREFVILLWVFNYIIFCEVLNLLKVFNFIFLRVLHFVPICFFSWEFFHFNFLLSCKFFILLWAFCLLWVLFLFWVFPFVVGFFFFFVMTSLCYYVFPLLFTLLWVFAFVEVLLRVIYFIVTFFFCCGNCGHHNFWLPRKYAWRNWVEEVVHRYSSK